VTKFLTWDVNFSFLSSKLREGEFLPGILQDLFGMVLMGVVYHACLILIEKGLFRKLKNKVVSSTTDFVFARKTSDDDVLAENSRVEKLVSGGKENL
jgi:hypothetical protein